MDTATIALLIACIAFIASLWAVRTATRKVGGYVASDTPGGGKVVVGSPSHIYPPSPYIDTPPAEKGDAEKKESSDVDKLLTARLLERQVFGAK